MMYQNLTCFLLSLLSFTAMGQMAFNNGFDTGSGTVQVNDCTVDGAGNFLLLYEQNDQLALMKTTADGVPIWSRSFDYGIDQGFYGPSLAAHDDVYFIGGFLIGSVTQSRDAFGIWLDTAGQVLHEKLLDVGGVSNAIHTVEATDDGFIASGRVDLSPNSYDMLLMKFDLAGNVSWTRSYGSNDWDWGRHAIETQDNGYAIVGYADGFTGGFSDAYFVKTDSVGNVEFETTLASSSADEFSHIVQSDSGHYFLAGLSLSLFTPNLGSAIICRADASGNVVWTTALDQFYQIKELEVTPSGDVMFMALAQNIYSGNFGGQDIVYGLIDPNGVIKWTRVVGSTDNESPDVLVRVGMDDFAIAGSSNNGGLATAQPFIYRLNDNYFPECSDSLVEASTPAFTISQFSVTGIHANLTDSVTAQLFSSNKNALALPNIVNTCCQSTLTAGFSFAPNPSDTISTFDFSSTATGSGQITWDFGDGNTGTGATPTHTYSGAGTYQVCQSIQNSCSIDSECQSLTVSNTVGTAAGPDQLFRIYPNPTAERVFIQSTQPLERLQLINAQGQMLRDIHPDASSNMTLLRLHDLPNGLYWIRVQQQDRWYSQEVLKME